MEELPGALGTSASLALRLGQAAFASASLFFMCLEIDFYTYTAFCMKFNMFVVGMMLMVTTSVIRINSHLRRTCVLYYFKRSYLVTVMGLMVPWSMTLAIVDGYSVFVRHLPPQTRVTSIIVTGDWVLSFLSLGAACSTASVAEILLEAGASYCPAKLCSRYRLSAAMAFLSWFLSLVSSLFNLWLLPSL